VRFGVFAWKPGDTIAPGAGRSRRVVDVRNTLSKLGCRTRTQAATRAIELRLVEPSPSH
jgi:hypothetical protein